MMRRIKNFGHFLMALSACFVYGYPARKMMVLAITGTDGKTSTAFILFHILKKAKLPVSMISTVKAVIGNENYDTGFHVTTPSPFFLQKLIKKALKEGSRYLVLETTSHALDQFRTLGTSIDAAVITNISHEHLDYHGNMENYRNAKARIMQGAKTVVLNKDDENYTACNFSGDSVRIEQRLNNKNRVMVEIKNYVNFPKNDLNLGIKVNKDKVECLVNDNIVAYTYYLSPALSNGGIGFKIWDPQMNNSELIVRHVSVEEIK